MDTFNQYSKKQSDKSPKKGLLAWEIAQRKKKGEQNPERVKCLDYLGNKNHKVVNETHTSDLLVEGSTSWPCGRLPDTAVVSSSNSKILQHLQLSGDCIITKGGL